MCHKAHICGVHRTDRTRGIPQHLGFSLQLHEAEIRHAYVMNSGLASILNVMAGKAWTRQTPLPRRER
jgi:hypothetical protein